MNTTSTSIASIAVAALLSPVALAQTTYVYPTQAQSAEGESSVNSYVGGLPWWSNPDQSANARNFRMQMITDLPASTVGSINQISYRRDGATLAGFNLQQFDVDFEITMSTSPQTAQSALPTFGSNVGNDATVVRGRRSLRFGAPTFEGTFPEPFVFKIPFDTPFPYDGSKGSLCMDVKHWDNDMRHPQRLTPLVFEVDAMIGSSQAATLHNGGRCTSPNDWLPPIELRSVMVIDESVNPPVLNFHAQRQYGQHHSRGFLIMSMDRVAPGMGAPAPTSIRGVPGCGEILMDPASQFLMTFNGSDEFGRVRWPADPSQYLFQCPWDNFWQGYQFYCQELNFDVHTQEYRVSNWVLTQVPVYLGSGNTFPMRTVYDAGPGSLTSQVGTLGQLGIGPVTEFTTQ